MNINITESRCPHITVSILGSDMEGLLDSGAAVSIVSDLNLIEKHNFKTTPTNLRIRTADGTSHGCLSSICIPYTFRGVTKVIPTLLVPNIAKPLILGNDFWKAFKIVPTITENGKFNTFETNGAKEKGMYINFVEDYFGEVKQMSLKLEPTQDVIETSEIEEDLSLELPSIENPDKTMLTEIDTEHLLTEKEKDQLLGIVNKLKGKGKLGRTTVLEHKIDLMPGEKPKKPPRYRWSPAIQKEMEKEIDRMKEMDIIELSESDWCNPLLPVKKSSGEWRLCLDCRRVNEVTKKEAYPFPDMQMILGRIEKAKYFSIIDLSKAYWQIPLAEESRDYTSFRAGKHLYRFKVMPFGLTGAPITQTKLMNRVLGYDMEPQVFVYLDDIVVTSNTLEEHLKLLETISERLSKANLSISAEKSKFCQKRISYLGYILSEEGLSIDSSKLEPILSYPSPKTLKEVRRLMGMVGFYKQFIPNYSTILAPITDLLKKSKAKLIWTEDADKAFNEIKSVLTSPPILANPDFNQQFVIESDASLVAAGAVLVQHLNGCRRPIAFFSKKFSSAQRKYSATERECLAVILAIEKFRHYVEGTQFKVITDAQSLKWLNKVSVEGSSARLVRWALKLQQHNIVLEYRKGKLNIVADALSRAVNEVDVLTVDLDLEKLKTDIEKGGDKYKDFKVIRGNVYKYIPSCTPEDSRFDWKYIPPKADRIQILEAEHGVAHFGYYKTMRKVREKYYWPGMCEEIKRFCRGCQTCKTSKYPNTARVPQIGRPKIATMPWQVVSVDYMGPFPRSKKGNTMILVVTDHFSKFVIIQPMREAKTAQLVMFVESMIFLLFGVPEILISDNGPQFKSSLFASLLKKYKVNHWKNANYHPANNPTERVNRVIGAAIRSYLKDEQKEWDENLQKIAMAIRTAVHESTEFTPYFVNYGRNYISSGDEYSRMRELGEDVEYDPKELSHEKKEIFEKVRMNLKKAYEKYGKYYNLRSTAKPSEFQVGEMVLKKNFFLSNKAKGFNADTYSPAKVIAKLGSNCYELEDVNGHKLGVYRSADLQKNRSGRSPDDTINKRISPVVNQVQFRSYVIN